MKAWTFHGSSHPLLNDSLNTMRGSGWTLEIADDGTHIFSRSRDSSSLEENSAAQELIMNDKEDMTLSQLATCQIGHSNNIARGVLSTKDCDTKKSDESDKLNNDTNDGSIVNDKTEGHICGVDSVSYSESIEDKSV